MEVGCKRTGEGESIVQGSEHDVMSESGMRTKGPHSCTGSWFIFNVFTIAPTNHGQDYNYVPNRKQPGSLRDSRAFVSIILSSSSTRSGWISASTITAKGCDIFKRVVEEEYNRLARTGLWIGRKALDDRSKRRQALPVVASTFICLFGKRDDFG